MSTVAVFVYGTLKRGEENHPLVEDLVASIRPAFLEGFTLFANEAFPGARPAAKGRRVRGEILELRESFEALRRLDALEQTPDLFVRARATVRLASGRTEEVWTYLLAKSPPLRGTKGGTWFPQGDSWIGREAGRVHVPGPRSAGACWYCGRKRFRPDEVCQDRAAGKAPFHVRKP